MNGQNEMQSARDAEFAKVALPEMAAVTRVARALTRDSADAEDLVQDTYLRAFRHWDTFEPGSDCKRWLSTICRNAHYGKESRKKFITAVGDDHELETFAAVDLHKLARERGLDDLFNRLELGPAIAKAIQGLEPAHRDVVNAVDVKGLRYEEAAEELAIPIGTVRSRLYRARRQLQKELIEHAIDLGLAPEMTK